ncbi:MAG: hypothetical protein ACRBG0_21385 [Lewinella sp.]|uniref:hypothetical protein n=1 Tax=Lewinella sp. TaxID=2004506 RepID=UPI003D6AA6DB
MDHESNIDINSGNDTWFYDQSIVVETAKSEKTDDELIKILKKNRTDLENHKYEYVKAVLGFEKTNKKEYELEKRARINAVKRILNINHTIMFKLSHNGASYETSGLEFERPGEIIERLTPKVKKDTGCYITTATLRNVGIPLDNCPELALFRNFRDEWVMNKHPSDVYSYYKLAPIICSRIEELHNSNEVYDYLYNSYITQGYNYLLDSDYNAAFELYGKMVSELVEKYIPEKC